MGRRRRGRHGKRGRDFISDLPDHLLHCILVRLKSARAAARTSVLSSRWRCVWRDLPELVYGHHDEPWYTWYIDASLKAYSAPTVSALDISVTRRSIEDVHDGSVDAWLRFASRRVTGTFTLDAHNSCRRGFCAEIYLPPFERPTSIDIYICPGKCLLRFHAAGTFAALTNLRIETAYMEAGEFEALVSSCPRLTDLAVTTELFLPDPDAFIDDPIRPSFRYHWEAAKVVPNFSVRCRFLKRLVINLDNVQRLEVVAPALQVLTSRTMYEGLYVSAPELAEVNVRCLHLCQFIDARRYLRRLKVDDSSLMQRRRFSRVDELTLQANPKTDQYNRFLDDIKNLPECEILRVALPAYHNGFVTCILHILRKANGARKIVIDRHPVREDTHCRLTNCPCRLPGTSNADITFASLEEIAVDHFDEGDGRLEFLELLLSRCSAPKLTSLRIINTWRHCYIPGKVVEKLRSMCPPNVRLTITRGSVVRCF